MHWSNPVELMELFGIDTSKQGAKDFDTLCMLVQLFRTHKDENIYFQDVVSAMCRENNISELVFWSRIKRTIRPLLDADNRVLQALGVKCYAHYHTVPVMVQSIVDAMPYKEGEEDSYFARVLAIRIRGGKA